MQVRSATLAEVGIAPCELKFRAAGKKGKETPDRRSSEGHAASCSRERRWRCSLLDACEAEVKGRNEHTR